MSEIDVVLEWGACKGAAAGGGAFSLIGLGVTSGRRTGDTADGSIDGGSIDGGSGVS